MSNKTQLQTNNTALDGYIARINAAKEVAAGLPEAGGSGGGGSVETCTVTLNCDCPSMGNEQLWYTDGSSKVKTLYFPAFGQSASITVIKNSILCANSSIDVSGNATVVYSNLVRVCFISGDATIKLA